MTPVSASLTGTATGDVGGTFGYMAPEQVRGHPCDIRTDVFAFGCVFYEMLAGRRAFPGTAASDTSRVVADNPPSLRSVRAIVPASLEHLVGRCLEKRPDDRFRIDARPRIGPRGDIRGSNARWRVDVAP